MPTYYDFSGGYPNNAEDIDDDAGNDLLYGGIDTIYFIGSGLPRLAPNIEHIVAYGTGNDTYVLGRGYGARVIESDKTKRNSDVVQFRGGIARDQVWFQRAGNDLVASIIGTSDQLTLQDWYRGSQYHVEQFRAADGATLFNGQVENLVNAMASFVPPSPGETTLPDFYSSQLAPVIAANWQ